MTTKSKKTIYPTLAENQETFSTFDTARILNLKRERLRQWANWGFIPGGMKVAFGKGYKIVWSRFQLYSISLFQKLVDAGLNRKTAATCVEAVDWQEVVSFGQKYLLFAYSTITDEKRIILVKKREALAKMGDEEILVFVNLEQIRRAVDSRI